MPQVQRMGNADTSCPHSWPHLSPAETRTLEHVIAGDTPAETAAALGIAVPTIRTHLAHIFEKTGTSRQAELIALAAKFAAPTAPPSGG
jgi:DNA-binding CsgD family transcriptional regulator